MIKILTIAMFLCSSSMFAESDKEFVKNHFSSIADVDPSIIVEARYFSKYNFAGSVIDGYKADKCIILNEAAKALQLVQSELKEKNLSLKVYDCYRPQKAVNHFVRWANDLDDHKMKVAFYPTLTKKQLLEKVYIATKSSHSTGNAVDLTIVPLGSKTTTYPTPEKLTDCTSKDRYKDNSLDMGSDYDCFHPISHTKTKLVGKKLLENRLILKTVMEKHGFRNYSKEWWHFNYKRVKTKKQFFDFDVQ